MAKKTEKLLPFSSAQALREIALGRGMKAFRRGDAVYVRRQVIDSKGAVIKSETHKIARSA